MVLQSLSKCLVPGFSKVDSVKREFDIPFSGIGKINPQLICQVSVKQTQSAGFPDLRFGLNLCSRLHGWRGNQKNGLSIIENSL